MRSYAVKLRKDGKTLVDAAQAKNALSRLLYDRGYIVEERSGTICFSQVEDFYVKGWPDTKVEISESGDHLIFTFSISPVKSALFLLNGDRLKFHVLQNVFPEWKYLRMD